MSELESIEKLVEKYKPRIEEIFGKRIGDVEVRELPKNNSTRRFLENTIYVNQEQLNKARQGYSEREKKVTVYKLAHILRNNNNLRAFIPNLKIWRCISEGFAYYVALEFPEIYQDERVIKSVKEICKEEMNPDIKSEVYIKGYEFFKKVGEKIGKENVLKVFENLPRNMKEILEPELYLERNSGKLNLEMMLKERKLTSYAEITKNEEELKKVAAELYGYKKEQIKIIENNAVEYNVSKVTIQYDVNERSFYIKDSWEGGLKEALGLEFNNLLTDQPIPYIFCGNLLVTDEVLGEAANKVQKDDRRYAKSYGKLEEFVKVLQLGDRAARNILITENCELKNIDFGFTFCYRFIFCHNHGLKLPKPNNKEKLREGRREGSQIIYENLKKNLQKIKKLIECLTKETIKAVNEKSIHTNIRQPMPILTRYAQNQGWIGEGEDLFQRIEGGNSGETK